MEKREKIRIFIYISVLGFIICLLTRYISPLYNKTQIDTDILFTIGRGWLNGKMPYRDLYDHKGFILHFLYMLSAMIQSNGYIGIFIIDCLIIIFDLFGLYKLISLFFKDKKYQFITLTIIAITMHLHYLGGLILQSETIAIGCYSYALYLMIKQLRDNITITNKQWYLIGITSSLLLWSKMTLTGFYIGYIIPYFILCIKQKTLKQFFKNIGFIVLGILTITLPFFIYMYIQDYFKDFIQVYFYDNIFKYKSMNNDNIYSIPKYLCYINLSLFPIMALIIRIKSKKKVFKSLIDYKTMIIFSFITTWIGQFLNKAGWGYYYTPFIIWTCLALIIILQKAKEKEFFKDIFKIQLLEKNIWKFIILGLILIMYSSLIFGKTSDIYYLQYLDIREDIINKNITVIENDWQKDITPKVMEYDLVIGDEYIKWDYIPEMKYFAFLYLIWDEAYEERDRLIEEQYPDYIISSIKKEWIGYEVISDMKIRETKKDKNYDILNEWGYNIYIYRKVR